MVTVSNVAQRVLDENNYTGPSKTIVEYLIDNAIDYVNLMASTSIADLAGSAEAKSLTATEDQIIVVKTLSALMIRAYKDRGPNTAIAGLSVTSVLADPQYSLFKEIIDKGIQRLQASSLPFKVAEATS